ncbi:MAG TPA: ATP-binding protein [Actinomycetota bacterium]|nr:ATP-binding protein [Actinomycetota bacterium]
MPSLAPPLLFATHLLLLLVALAAALALAREPRGITARLAGALGFLVLAVGWAVHGAGFLEHGAPELDWVLVAGFALLAIAALLPRAARGAPVVVASPGAVLPAAAGIGAGLITWWRRRAEQGSRWLGPALILLGGAHLAADAQATWASAAAHAMEVAGALCVARAVFALTRYSVRFRFMASFTALLLAVVLFVSVAIGTVIDRNLRQGALVRLVGQAEDAQTRMEKVVSDEVGTLVQLGSVESIADAIGRGGGVPTQLIAELQRELFADVDFILFLDRRGSVSGRLGLRAGAAIDVVGTDTVEFAITQRREVSSLDELSRGGLVLIGVAPITPSAGEAPAGFAVAGFRLDEDLLRREVIAGRGTRAMAFQGFRGRPPDLVAWAGFDTARPSAPERRLAEAYRAFLAGGEAVGTALDLAGSEHFAAMSPLRQAQGRPVGLLVVAEPAAVLGQTQRDVNRVLFLVTVGVVGLAFLLAMAAARRITRPLVTLTRAARRVQAGDLETRAPVRGEDEVADLAVAFNRMTESVGSMTGALQTAADEQARLRSRLETVVDSMGDGLIAVDDRERVVTYNPAAADLVGVPSDAVLGRTLGEVLRGRDAAGRSLTRGRPAEGLAFVRRADGAEVPTALSSAPLRDRDGGAIGRVYVLRDMTREYEVERMKREFLSNVSHELRTPLTPIIGYSELMTRRDLPGDRTREFSASILEAARRLERIVAMLVDFSAIEAGRARVATERLDVRPVVEAAAGEIRERTDRHRIETDVPSDLPPAEVNQSLFRRMLDELLDNAVKYSPQGGRVGVAVASVNSGPRRMLRIAVSDQGIGIEPEDLARIFQDFRQVDASDTRQFGGLGLGLAFVKRVAEAHGGGVSAESEPARGSTFTFTVPTADGSGEGS